jgi:hypothetical protein
MEPAYDIPLTDAQILLLGELRAIQGQIEYGMQQIVRRLEGIKPQEARKLLSAGGMKANADKFISIVRNRCNDASLVRLAEKVYSSLATTSKGRNDFVHAIIAMNEKNGFSLSFNAEPASKGAVAVRTKNYKKTALDVLPSVRDEAAKISCAMAHIYFCLMSRQNASAQSPWIGRF